ncbi:hypothetical protein SND65_01820 [Escherichia coli]|nr:hypothetical protein [Escherichia coli]
MIRWCSYPLTVRHCCKRRCTRTYCRYWCSYALGCDWLTWTHHHR